MDLLELIIADWKRTEREEYLRATMTTETRREVLRVRLLEPAVKPPFKLKQE